MNSNKGEKKIKFGEWFFKRQKKEVERLIDKMDIKAEDIKIMNKEQEKEKCIARAVVECDEDHNGECYYCGRNMLLHLEEKLKNTCKNCGQESIARDGHFDCSPPEEKLRADMSHTCTTPVTMLHDWEEEFDKYFYVENDNWNEDMGYPSPKTLKRIIKRFLSSHNARLIERAKEIKCTGTMKDLPEMREFNHGIDKVIQIIKEEQL